MSHVEDGQWIMRGLAWNDPGRIRTWQELVTWIDKIGFVPLFRNEVEGFSVEEHTSTRYWWTGSRREDPWEWREIIAADRQVAYGKFFDGKAGFISLAWLPYFANFRRNGYDFDARFDDELASFRDKRLFDLLDANAPVLSKLSVVLCLPSIRVISPMSLCMPQAAFMALGTPFSS